jgi:hypothetical protein
MAHICRGARGRLELTSNYSDTLKNKCNRFIYTDVCRDVSDHGLDLLPIHIVILPHGNRRESKHGNDGSGNARTHTFGLEGWYNAISLY